LLKLEKKVKSAEIKGEEGPTLHIELRAWDGSPIQRHKVEVTYGGNVVTLHTDLSGNITHTLNPDAAGRRLEVSTDLPVKGPVTKTVTIPAGASETVRFVDEKPEELRPPKKKCPIRWWLIALAAGSGAVTGYLIGRRGKE